MKIKSLKSNIFLYLIIFTVIPLLIGTSVVTYKAYGEKLNSIKHNHYQILQQATQEIDNLLNKIELLGQYVKDEYPRKKHNLLTGLVRIQQDIPTILILDNNGVLIDFASKSKIDIFKGSNYSNEAYFKEIKNGKKEYWTKVYLSSITNHPSLSYSIRIDKNRIGILVIDLNLLSDFAKKYKSGDGSSMIRITDSDGVFIAHPERPKAIQQRKTILNTDVYKRFMVKDYKNKQIEFIGIGSIKNIGIYGVTDKLRWQVIVKEDMNYLFQTFYNIIWFIILFSLFLIAISVYFSFKLSKSILKPLDTFSKNMDDIAHDKELEKIDNIKYKELELLSSNFLTMQQNIKNREELNREKDKQLHDSIKMAQMGEMIGNIAHQWRQPLNIISTSASGMKLEKEFDMLDDNKFIKYCDLIVDNTQFLSETIDTFRDFIKEKKELKMVKIQNRLDNILNILSTSLENNHIKFINNIDYETTMNVEIVLGELSQVIINIFNNSKDALVERKIDKPYIKITTIKENNFVNIIIHDNAKGIPEDILPKIFDPYFTTKHQSQGTGLGLHMSYKIITQSLKGKISAKNENDGATFTIQLPLV
ncbi:MAG: hypothetical protein DRG78_01710 [Epsilonproteobacteria bacterium]|nr:MAG: hypothetical protein DRG78_01710 [Campylobacterota bacterium]